MTSLPIDSHLPAINEELQKHRSLVLVAEPGAGKTTRVPPAILLAGLLSQDHPNLLLLQPRRVAARAVSARIADEQGWTLGQEVGYHVRFDRRIHSKTRLRVLTEGILTRHLLADPFLEGVGAVVLDEFHERSLHTDLAAALLLEVRESVRKDLILVVMSATLDAEPIAQFLGGAPILRVEGRTFPVEVEHLPPDGSSLPERVASALRMVMEGPEDPGDILVFLPGVEEIRRSARAIEPWAERNLCDILPLHGSLSAEDQDRALRPSDRRKVVLATNIAETSLTIDGVRTVIDSGLARQAGFDNARELDRLELGRISRASATQRAGRAGRTAPGRCLRLWAERETRGMPEFDLPEILRVDLSGTALTLHAWGLADLTRFAWYEAPAIESLAAADRLLEMLGALDPKTGQLTEIGRQMLPLPVHPRLGRLLLAASAAGLKREGATLAALLSEKDILALDHQGQGQRPNRPSISGRSDLLMRLDRLAEAEQARFGPAARSLGIDLRAARQVARVRDDLLRLARRLPEPDSSQRLEAKSDEAPLLRALLLAYPDRVVKRRGPGESSGVMVGGRGVRLTAESVLRDVEFYLALDAREDRRGGTLELRVRIASAIEESWLEQLFPGHLHKLRSIEYDEERRRVVGFGQTRYRDLVLREDRHIAVDPEEAAAALAEALGRRAVTFFRDNESANTWIDRLESLRAWRPDLDLPNLQALDLADLLKFACLGKRTEDEVRRVSLVPLLQGRLTRDQLRALDELAPATITVPSGNQIRLTYEPGRPPILAVRLQELFGWAETPRVAGGKVPVLLHLLGPNFRPVQVTDDLRSFWTTTYLQVRKDLRSRYPKHSWPEDPWTAKAESKGGRRH